jgi:hypothetical protein
MSSASRDRSCPTVAPWSRVLRIVVCVSIGFHLPAAHADAIEKPWVRGVSKEQKARAQVLLERGNAEFLQNHYKEALALYEQALVQWDHPAIRFNSVRALVALDRTLAAQDNLEKALAYGAEPLEEAVFREALNYQRLLASSIGNLELRCAQPGVSLRVDGTTFLTCPGSRVQRMTPGRHAVSASGDGLIAQTIDAVVTPAKTEMLSVTLVPIGNLVAHARWTAWKPWAVVAGGVAVVGVGAAFRFKAANESTSIENIVRDRCQAACTPDQYDLGEHQRRLDRDNLVWTAGLVIGATAFTTGLTLVILNRPQLRVGTKELTARVIVPDAEGVVMAVSGAF